MANETPDKAAEQAKANAEAAEVYKQAVDKTFSDGKKVATVKQYVPSRLTNGQARQCFLVNYGHPNCSFFVPCKEFMEQFTPYTKGDAAPQPETHLPQ